MVDGERSEGVSASNARHARRSLQTADVHWLAEDSGIPVKKLQKEASARAKSDTFAESYCGC